MHLTNFLEVCDTMKYNGVTEEALRLRLFPLSLGDRAKHWLTSQPPDSITSRNNLVQIMRPREKTTLVKAVGDIDNEVLNNLVTHVAQLTKQLTRQQGTANAIQNNPWELCEFCGGQHNSIECQSGNQTVEQAQYVSRFNQSQS